ncbi:MAG: penicillin-binding protein [bacterium]
MNESGDRRQFWIRVRMGMVAGLVSLLFVAVIVRVYHLQVVQAAKMHERAVGQQARDITVQARRGGILDRNGVELAVSVEAPSFFLRPRSIKDPALLAQKLAPILDMDAATIEAKARSKSPFVWLKRQGTPAEAEAVKALDLEGIDLTPESKRFYPLRERAGQLLGFVGIDSNGLEGIERTYESQMAGGEYTIQGYKDARGKTLLTEATPEFKKFEGKSVTLTIDERLQRVAEEAISEQVEKYEAKAGYAIVLDPKTGEILAMANTPSFDPNRFKEFTADAWRLKGVTDTFEPGSTFKPLVLAAALQEKTVTLNSRFDTEGGRIKIGKYTIRDSHAAGVLTAAEIVQESSNIGAYKIAQTLGRDKFYQYIRAFGFGRATGLKVRGEQPGLVWPPDRWAEVSFANIAFGQGLTATPLQMTNAIATVANGGMLMKPRLVRSLVDKDGKVVEDSQPTLIRRVLSPDVAKKTSWAMSLVTREGGTAKSAALEHYTVAGKTGTAQKVNPETRRYDPHMWLASFIGYAPAEDPEFVVLVMIDEPHKSHYGGVVAAPAFKKIMSEALALRGVRPLPREKRFQFDDEQALKELEALNEPQQIEMETVVLPPVANDDPNVVPDFRGMTLREAIERSRQMGQLPKVEGWGRVVSQEPPAGTALSDEIELSFVLSPATQQALIAEEPSTGTIQ